MKTCALCTRTTTPHNGVTNTADAVLCTFCLTGYQTSPEYRREQHFKSAGNEPAARAALCDFIFDTLKIRQVEYEAKTRADAEKAEAEKKAAEKEKAAKAPAAEPAKVTNGVPAKA